MRPVRLAPALLLTAALTTFSGRCLGAQAGVALNGRVLDRSTSTSIQGAVLLASASGKAATTDSLGRFAMRGLLAGPGTVMVRARGFPDFTLRIDGKDGETIERTIQLDSTAGGKSEAQILPTVSVSAPASRGPRYVDFERRQKNGRGQYLTAEDLMKGGFSNLQEAVRTLRGVIVECGGGGGCYIRMVRAPMYCLPEYVVDERVDPTFGPRTPLRDIEALEVYTGAADVPGEFAGRNAGCGVIVIWTKAGPPRKKP